MNRNILTLAMLGCAPLAGTGVETKRSKRDMENSGVNVLRNRELGQI